LKDLPVPAESNGGKEARDVGIRLVYALLRFEYRFAWKARSEGARVKDIRAVTRRGWRRKVVE
jgi:hypothetical protein